MQKQEDNSSMELNKSVLSHPCGCQRKHLVFFAFLVNEEKLCSARDVSCCKGTVILHNLPANYRLTD